MGLWDTFEISGMGELADYIRESGGEIMPEYQVGQGIKDAMVRNGEAPVEDEQYLWEGKYSICASSAALYFYSFASNEVYRLPKV